MKRDLKKLENERYDLIIIGGGIFGACLAWEAALRGLSVALIEKADFGSGTSSNSLKIIHGGLRYLQQANFRRVRASIAEMRNWMRIAPHLVHPLPVAIPTYGYGMRGKTIMSLALMINDLLRVGRNALDDPEKFIPPGRIVSMREAMQLLPGIDSRGLTGAAIFYDAQAYNSERLLISFVRSAAERGATVANYLQVIGFLREKDRVIGVEAEDQLTKDRLLIRAKMVINASGPWSNRLCGLVRGDGFPGTVQFVKALNIVTRLLFETYAVGIAGNNGYSDSDTVLNKGSRLLFITPWRGYSLIGTAYTPFDGDADGLEIHPEEIRILISEVNRALPSTRLCMDDVSFIHLGLLPSFRVSHEAGDIRLAQRSKIYDHRHEGIKGIFSVVGVKYTAAREMAERVIDLVFESWGKSAPQSRSAFTPIFGGRINRFNAYLNRAIERGIEGAEREDICRLVYNYGSEYERVLDHLERAPKGVRNSSSRYAFMKAEVLHTIRSEMALTLSDVVFRRTELGTADHPGAEALKICAETMGRELAWDSVRVGQERERVERCYSFACGVAV